MSQTVVPTRSAVSEAEHDYHKADHRASRAQTRAEYVHELANKRDAERRIWACALRSFEEGSTQ